jgi:hypothetical protein
MCSVVCVCVCVDVRCGAKGPKKIRFGNLQLDEEDQEDKDEENQDAGKDMDDKDQDADKDMADENQTTVEAAAGAEPLEPPAWRSYSTMVLRSKALS